jgi:hypothetical protein
MPHASADPNADAPNTDGWLADNTRWQRKPTIFSRVQVSAMKPMIVRQVSLDIGARVGPKGFAKQAGGFLDERLGAHLSGRAKGQDDAGRGRKRAGRCGRAQGSSARRIGYNSYMRPPA